MNEEVKNVQLSQPRRPKMKLSPFGINHFHKAHPWVASWWSLCLPGFGHIHLGMYAKGFILMTGEILLNFFGHINEGIFYTFTLQFEKVNQTLNFDWALLYVATWLFSIYDSYRVSVEVNKYSWLEKKQNIQDFKVGVIAFDLNFLDKRTPWVAAFWSTVFPGLGHIYCHRIISGFILMGWTIVIAIQTNLGQLIIYTFTGQFELIHRIIDYQWILFMPSIYFFSIYDAYSHTISYNRLFRDEQLYYLKNKYGANPIEIN